MSTTKWNFFSNSGFPLVRRRLLGIKESIFVTLVAAGWMLAEELASNLCSEVTNIDSFIPRRLFFGWRRAVRILMLRDLRWASDGYDFSRSLSVNSIKFHFLEIIYLLPPSSKSFNWFPELPTNRTPEDKLSIFVISEQDLDVSL